MARQVGMHKDAATEGVERHHFRAFASLRLPVSLSASMLRQRADSRQLEALSANMSETPIFPEFRVRG
jgi:hypothetical protein